MRPSWPAPTMPTVMGVSVARVRVARAPAAVCASRNASQRGGDCRVARWRGWRRRSSAALVAPAVPMAKVATGTPAGICTIDSSESMPFERFRLHRHAQHRQRGLRGRHAGQMRRAAGAGDDDLEAARARAGGVFEQQVRRAMRGDHAHLVRDRQACRAFRRRRCIVSQSDDEPMMMPTRMPLCYSPSRLAYCPPQSNIVAEAPVSPAVRAEPGTARGRHRHPSRVRASVWADRHALEPLGFIQGRIASMQCRHGRRAARRATGRARSRRA